MYSLKPSDNYSYLTKHYEALHSVPQRMSRMTNERTNSMEQSLSSEANSFSPSQEIPGILRNPKVH